MTSTQWVEYHVGTKRKSYNSLPTSNITAEAVTVDGFALSQSDSAGVTTTASRSNHPALWFITWGPPQPIATRPLAIQKDATWYTYGWDLTKNICELYGSNGYIRTAYTYSPYGEVSESANGVYQPIQWSSEYNDTELGLVYYNYRHYNPLDGRWIGRDLLNQNNMYAYLNNHLYNSFDYLGKDRAIITFKFNRETLFFHSTLRIDNWIVVNGKYERNGYVHYDFRPLFLSFNNWATVWTFVNLGTSLIYAHGIVEKTYNHNKIEDFTHMKTTPCDDIALMEELDKEVGKDMFYNLFVYNCQIWKFFRYHNNSNCSKCCNPDGTLYEE